MTKNSDDIELYHHFPSYVTPNQLRSFYKKDNMADFRRRLSKDLFKFNSNTLRYYISEHDNLNCRELNQIIEELWQRGFHITYMYSERNGLKKYEIDFGSSERSETELPHSVKISY